MHCSHKILLLLCVQLCYCEDGNINWFPLCMYMNVLRCIIITISDILSDIFRSKLVAGIPNMPKWSLYQISKKMIMFGKPSNSRWSGYKVVSANGSVSGSHKDINPLAQNIIYDLFVITPTIFSTTFQPWRQIVYKVCQILFPQKHFFLCCQVILIYSTLLLNYFDFITTSPKVLHMGRFVSVLTTRAFNSSTKVQHMLI